MATPNAQNLRVKDPLQGLRLILENVDIKSLGGLDKSAEVFAQLKVHVSSANGDPSLFYNYRGKVSGEKLYLSNGVYGVTKDTTTVWSSDLPVEAVGRIPGNLELDLMFSASGRDHNKTLWDGLREQLLPRLEEGGYRGVHPRSSKSCVFSVDTSCPPQPTILVVQPESGLSIYRYSFKDRVFPSDEEIRKLTE